jgi:aryl-alcohol dehydrogenase-like predicted oxidoreductase
MKNKLVIGAAQFGMDYGIANTNGKLSQNEIKHILDYAMMNGVSTIDTAISYGESESNLGKIGVENWRIITKLPEIPESCNNKPLWINNHIQESISRLKISNLDAILLHNPNQLLNSDGNLVWRVLQDLREKGTVNKIGYSIYNPHQLNELYSKFKPDLVQSPYNVFDRRIKTSGWLQKFNDSGTEFHARSVFLQGLLLMKLDNMPKKFKPWNSLWIKWNNWLEERNISALEACLSFVLSERLVNHTVVGVDSLSQLQQILFFYDSDVDNFPLSFSTTDQNLINPSNWGVK